MTAFVLNTTVTDSKVLSAHIEQQLAAQPGMQHCYALGIFSATETAFAQRLGQFQRDYGLAWWSQANATAQAASHRHQMELASRPLPVYWQALPHAHSMHQRAYRYGQHALQCMEEAPPALQSSLSEFRTRWNAHQAEHSKTLEQLTQKSKPELWGRHLTGANLAQQMQQLVVPVAAFAQLCLILADAPIEEYDALCQP